MGDAVLVLAVWCVWVTLCLHFLAWEIKTVIKNQKRGTGGTDATP